MLQNVDKAMADPKLTAEALHLDFQQVGQVRDPEISQSADKKSADILAIPQRF